MADNAYDHTDLTTVYAELLTPEILLTLESITNDDHLYCLLNDVFCKVMNNLLSENELSPQRKQALAQIESQSIHIGNVLFKSSVSELSPLEAILEKAASLPMRLSIDTYIAFLRWIVNSPNPSFDSIWYCFRGLYTYSLSIKTSEQVCEGAIVPLSLDVFEMLISGLAVFIMKPIIDEHKIKKIKLILDSAKKIMPIEKVLFLMAPIPSNTSIFAKEWALSYFLAIQQKYLDYEKKIQSLSEGLDNHTSYHFIFNELQLLHNELKNPGVIRELLDLASCCSNTRLDNKTKRDFAFKIAPLDSLYQNMLRVFFMFYRKERNNVINIRQSMAIELAGLLETMMALNSSRLSINTVHTVALILAPYIDASEARDLVEFNDVYTIFKQLFHTCVEQIEGEKKAKPALDNSSKEILLYETILVYTLHLYQRSNDVSYLSYGMKLINGTSIILDFELYKMYMEFVVVSANPNVGFIWACFKKLQKQLLNDADVVIMFGILKAALDVWLVANIDTSQAVMHFSKNELKIIIAQMDISQNRRLIEGLWSAFLQTLVLHKACLSEAQYQKIDRYADTILNDPNANLMDLNVLLKLMSYSTYPNVSAARSIHERIQQKFGSHDVLYDEHLFRILQKAATVSLVDFDYFRANLNLEKSEKNKVTFFNILLDNMIRSPNPSETVALILFCNQHFQKEMADEDFFINDNKASLNRMFEGLAAEMIVIFSAQAEIIHREHQAYQELQQLKITYQKDVVAQRSYLPQKIVMALLNVLVTIDSIHADKHYLPSEKQVQLKAIFCESTTLQRRREQAKESNVKINALCIQFCEALNLGLPDVTLMRTINQQCKHTIEAEIAKQLKLQENAAPIDVMDAWTVLKQGDVQELKQLNNNLATPSHYINLYLIKIKCLVKLGYFDHALHWIAKTRNMFPDKSNLFLLLQWASCCVGLGQFVEALAAYQKVYALQKNANRLTLANIAYCHMLINKPNNLGQAYDIYVQLLQDTTDNEHMKIMRCIVRCLVSQARLVDAEQHIKSLPEWETNADAQALLGSLSWQKNEMDSAIIYYEKAIRYHNNVYWMKSLLSCYQKTHNTTKAKEILEQIEQQIDSNYEEHRLKTAIYLQHKQYDKALIVLNQMTAHWGKNQMNYINIARCYRGLNRFDDAIEHLSAFPDYKHNATVVEQLALTYCAAGKQAQALETYDYLLQEFPSKPYPYIKAIAYFMKINDRARVMQYWEYCQSEFTEYDGLFAQTEQQINKYYAHDVHAYTDDIADEVDIDDEKMEAIESLNCHYATAKDNGLVDNRPLIDEEIRARLKEQQTRRYNPRYADNDMSCNLDVLDLAYPVTPSLLSTVVLKKLGLYKTDLNATSTISKQCVFKNDIY